MESPYSRSRRSFLRQSAVAAGLACVGQLPFEAYAEKKTASPKLTVLHTNDVHSRLDPFAMDGSKYQGMGGVLAREKLIRSIRETEQHVLLLDAGDMVQGTPYYNVFKGEPELKIMSMLKYDAATLGNHDFDNGIEGLVAQLQHANFPIVNCNYDVRGTPLEHIVQPYTILRRGQLRIGIFGVGIALDGLVPAHLYGSIQYLDPVVCANETAWFLKQKKRCDYIICLSHLGFEYSQNKVSDKVLAANSEYIHFIIGGHTHTFLDQPYITKNLKSQDVIVNQVGWAGIQLGCIDIYFDNKKDYDYVSNFTAIPVKETRI
jgi:5'-nucleotidase